MCRQRLLRQFAPGPGWLRMDAESRGVHAHHSAHACVHLAHPHMLRVIPAPSAHVPRPLSHLCFKLSNRQPTDGIVKAVQQLRAKSMIGLAMAGKGGAAPQLLVKQGAVAARLHSAQPNPPNRVIFSPDGKYVLRYGNGNDVKLLLASNGGTAGGWGRGGAGRGGRGREGRWGGRGDGAR